MLTERLKASAINWLAWSSNRRLLVIESDDWGMVRMASPEAQKVLHKKHHDLWGCSYNRYDLLERKDDLEALYEVLESFRDKRGKPAVLTANMVMANPDFPKIEEDRFSCYHWEPFWKTLENQHRKDVLSLYRAGQAQGVFVPQLHGREHTAFPRWLAALKRGEAPFVDAFKEGMISVHSGGVPSGRRECLDALGIAPDDPAFMYLLDALSDAQSLFEKFWGTRSKSFIAPCYTWHPNLEKHMASLGIRYLQGGRVQSVPLSSKGVSYTRRRHFTGQRNRNGQLFMVRNVQLEPSLTEQEDACVDLALSQVASAFAHRTPAIVTSHRLNFMGGLDIANRDRGLRVLQAFLAGVQKHWTDVEFVSSDILGDQIAA